MTKMEAAAGVTFFTLAPLNTAAVVAVRPRDLRGASASIQGRPGAVSNGLVRRIDGDADSRDLRHPNLWPSLGQPGLSGIDGEFARRTVGRTRAGREWARRRLRIRAVAYARRYRRSSRCVSGERGSGEEIRACRWRAVAKALELPTVAATTVPAAHA